MPRFTPAVANEVAGIPLLPRGEYAFSIGELKPFTRPKQNPDGTSTNMWGLQTSIKITDADSDEGKVFVGKTLPFSLYMHGKSGSMNKQFAMAAVGYTLKQEAEFNEAFPDDEDGENWHVDTDENSIGTAWKELIGKSVRANVTQRPNKQDPNGALQNQFGWMPF